MASPTVVCVTFDNMGSAADVGAGRRIGQAPDDASLLIGYPRVLAMLQQLGIMATFFIEGWNASHNPSHVLAVSKAGHEIGVHGWAHEKYRELDAPQTERLLRDALCAFRSIGIEPPGFRAPGGGRGPHTAEVVKRLGFRFDSSIDEFASATVPALLDNGLPNIPWQWEMIDYYQYYLHPDGPRTPAEFESNFVREIERAAANGGFVTLIFHAFVSGVDEQRFEAMRRVLVHVKNEARFALRTAGEIADELSRFAAPREARW